MRLFDSHCHIDDDVFAKDLDAVYRRMDEEGVARAMAVGIDYATSAKAVSMATTNKRLFAAVGIHPHNAKTCSQTDLDKLSKLAEKPCVKAWGEIGLDFNRMFAPVEAQESCLRQQIEAARAFHLPIIFHERDTNGRLLEILEKRKHQISGGVIHCFSGNRRELKAALDMGLYIGVTGILTIKGRGAKLREMVKDIPDDRILIETDAPYLTPAPQKNRIRRNEPAFVKSVWARLAQVRNQDPEVLADTLWNNTCRLFNIEPTGSEI